MFGWRSKRGWMLAQIAAVVALFAGSLLSLWRAGADAIARDRRRAESVKILARADDAMAVRGARGLAIVPEWPDTLEPEDWSILDSWLTEEASKALSPFRDVGGGYFIPAADRYFGHAGATRAEPDSTRRSPRRPVSEPPSRERDLIDDQVREALERDRPIDRVVDMASSTVTVRAAPVKVNGRRVAVTWVVIHLDEGAALGRSMRSYQWATGLALGGLMLAIALTGSLTATIRRHVITRDRMEIELRRSERLAALGKLLAGVSHELRNPLAGLRSVAQLWQKGIVTNDELASELIAEIDRLDGIVVDLLMFSRAEPRSLVVGDLNDVVAEAVRLIRSTADGQGVVIDLACSPGLPPVLMDPAAVLRILRNLTSNALQAMPKGGYLRVSTRFNAERRLVETSVADSGSGLSREAQEHVFEPFFTTKPDGTGLGLAIAREIALAHHGQLRAGNRVGGGAEIVLGLPEGRGR